MPSDDATDDRPKPLRVALRWALTLGAVAGLAYAALRGTNAYRARATARLVATDFAQFSGCLFAQRPAPASLEAGRARVRELALGTGDSLWPHTCSRALSRLEQDARVAAQDDARDEALSNATRAMEAALAQGVLWTRHLEGGRRDEAPEWLEMYAPLRAQVQAMVARRGERLRDEEVPRTPRIARDPNAPEPPPRPTPLPFGTEADVVDAIATSSHDAVILRDIRSRYGLCVRDRRAPHAVFRCGPLAIPANGDPENARFVRAREGAPFALVRVRPPSLDRLALHEGSAPPYVLEDDPDPSRDVLALTDGSVWSFLGTPAAALVSEPTHARVSVPTGLAPRRSDRAIFPWRNAAGLAWIDALRGGPVRLNVWAPGSGTSSGTMGSGGGPSQADRGVRTCWGDRGAWIVPGDGREVRAYRYDEAGLALVGSFADAGDPGRYELRCTDGALLAVRSGSPTATVCTSPQGGCRALPAMPLPLGVTRDADFSDDRTLVVADLAGEPLRPRLRKLDLAQGTFTSVAFTVEPAPARRVVLRAARDRLLLVASGDDTYASTVPADGPASALPVVTDDSASPSASPTPSAVAPR